MWRPDDWKNDWVPKYGEQYWAYEAGADAMLATIRSHGYIKGESLRNTKGASGWASINPDSKWYPIPDEEKK